MDAVVGIRFPATGVIQGVILRQPVRRDGGGSGEHREGLLGIIRHLFRHLSTTDTTANTPVLLERLCESLRRHLAVQCDTF